MADQVNLNTNSPSLSTNNSDNQQNDSQLRSRLGKFKKELDNYSNLCLAHKEILCGIYDYYMDFTPVTIKRIYLVVFSMNKFFRLILVYFLFYHSIWWQSNSISNNLALNYSLINPNLFFIILYFNHYELLVNKLILKLIISNILKTLHLFDTSTLKKLLNYLEILIYIVVNLTIFSYLRFNLNYSYKWLSLFMIPHLAFLLYHNFDINITLFNFCLYTNQLAKPNLFDQSKEHTSTESNELNVKLAKGSFVYTDCSNLSVSNFLNQKLAIPSALSSYKTEAQSNLIKQSIQLNHRTKLNCKNRFSNSFLVSKISNYLHKNFKFISKRALLFIDQIYETLLSIPKTTRLKLSKRNTYFLDLNLIYSNFEQDMGYSLENTNNFVFNSNLSDLSDLNCIQHKCQKEAANLREETELFRFEFKIRLREALIRSIESIYFNFCLTRLCVPSILNIRDKEFYLYFVSSCLCTFISFFTYFIPMSFLISMYRNTEHLGLWCLETKTSQTSGVSKWTSSRVYFKGERASFMGKVYRVESLYCICVPGNRKHEYFYKVFSNPFRIIRVLFVLKFVNIALLCWYVILNRRWYAIITNIFEVLINSHTIFIVLRDFLLLFLKPNCFIDTSLINNNNNKKLD